jgi:hypothetical protein
MGEVIIPGEVVQGVLCEEGEFQRQVGQELSQHCFPGSARGLIVHVHYG